MWNMKDYPVLTNIYSIFCHISGALAYPKSNSIFLFSGNTMLYFV